MDILDPKFVKIFPQLPPDQQRQAVDHLKAKFTEIENAGSTEAQLALMGHPNPKSLPEDQRKTKVAIGLDNCYWQFTKFLRYSTPSRIEEAAPYIEKVLAHFAVQKPGQIDGIPLFYQGVALHKVPGQEETALNAFTTAFNYGADVGFTKVMLWARGSMSRLLRRMGKVPEAEEQEAKIRDWLRWHEYGMPRSEFIKLVTDPDHRGKDYIMEHPEMQKMCAGVVDLGSGIEIHIS